jgi:hypothetical protein
MKISKSGKKIFFNVPQGFEHLLTMNHDFVVEDFFLLILMDDQLYLDYRYSRSNYGWIRVHQLEKSK